MGFGEHAGEAFAGSKEVEIEMALMALYAFAVVAGAEHGEDLLGAVGDMEGAHDSTALRGHAGPVAGGGFEEILMRVFEPANEAYGDGGDAGVGVAAEGDDLAAVGAEVVECGVEHFEARGDFEGGDRRVWARGGVRRNLGSLSSAARVVALDDGGSLG